MFDGYNQGDVYVMDVDGSGLTNLTEHPAHDCCVAWALDGERLAFLSSRDERSQGNLSLTGAYRYRDQLVYAGPGGQPASPGMPRPLTTVMPERPRDIYLINADGSGLINLTNGKGYEKDHAWSPDGKWMVFVSDRGGNDQIYLQDVEAVHQGAGDPIRLADTGDDAANPVWSPDGTCLAFLSIGDSGSGLYVVGADGSGLTKLAEGIPRGSHLSWSP
jgi:TolB protein